MNTSEDLSNSHRELSKIVTPLLWRERRIIRNMYTFFNLSKGAILCPYLPDFAFRSNDSRSQSKE